LCFIPASSVFSGDCQLFNLLTPALFLACYDRSDLPSTEDGPPPPSIVLDRQLEVGQSDRDARGDTEQDRIDDKQNTIECVLLATPQRRKDIVQLHRYCTANATYSIHSANQFGINKVYKFTKIGAGTDHKF